MKLLVLLTIICSSLYAEKDCHHDDKNFRCVKYVKNYDADTITFDIPSVHPLLGKKINIRFKGIDSPELRTKENCEKSKARIGKSLVGNLLKHANRIDLLNVERGKYFRILAEVYVDGVSIAEYLLKNQLAVKYEGKAKQIFDWCGFGRDVASDK